MPTAKSPKGQNRYSKVLDHVFFSRWKKGSSEVGFKREDLDHAADQLGVQRLKNLGDVVYSFRYRGTRSERIEATQPNGKEWIIEGIGKSRYAFKLVKVNRIIPDPNYQPTKIPDATPEIIGAYALSDEQALLARVRYNRLIDIFLGVTAYSLQNHLRTTVKGIGQIEIDEVYVAVDKSGSQYVIPVQAKGGQDQLSVVQTRQDIRCCEAKFANLVCRAVSAQFIDSDRIALFELALSKDDVRIVDQRHYQLVPAADISASELKAYRSRRT